MHEFSIAEAICELAQRSTPAGCTLRRVKVIAGPMRCIDRTAMNLAWNALMRERCTPGVALDLELPPWSLLCPRCRRRWQSDALDTLCICGFDSPTPIGGDELQLISIEVDD